MTSYKLAPRDVENVRATAEMFKGIESSYRQWMPIERIDRAYISKWYTLEEIPGPALSVDGSDYMGVRTARLEGEAPLLYMRYKFHWDQTEVDAAQKAGIPLKADDAKVALRSIHAKIAQMIIEGLDVPDVITGATEVGTDLGAGLDTTYIGTQGNFTVHAQAISAHMITNGFRPPYNLILGSTIAPFQYLPQPGGHGKSQKDYMKETFDINTFVELSDSAANFALNIETGTEEVIPAMIYTADDGIWVALAANMENMAVQEVEPPRVTVMQDINKETNKFEGYVEWQGTVRFTHAAAAAFMEDVDVYAP